MNTSRRTRSTHAQDGAGHTGENASGIAQAVAAAPEPAHKHRLALAVTGAAASLALAVGGLAVGGLAAAPASAAENPTVAADSSPGTAIPFTGRPSGNGGSRAQSPNADHGSNGPGNSRAQGSEGTQQDATPASKQESTGVVLIDTQLGYEHAEAAGTGIVLSRNGLILTNNHVIADSTKIAVTVATTGKTYAATVVGSDATKDVAVLKLKDASDLTPATIDTDTVSVGDDVTAVGNSEGGGQLQAADGTVTDLGASVTTTAQGTEDSETLNNMIGVRADIVSGDSGGALLDSAGEVAGMDTAASSGTAVVTGYAIPIKTALTTAESIIDGQQTSTNTLGYPAFLGIGVQQDPQTGQSTRSGQPDQPSEGMSPGTTRPGRSEASGAVVAGVYENTPAAEAGLSAGDTITRVGSTRIADGTDLSQAIAEHKPGDTVPLTWSDANGRSHTAEVTLTEGPAA